MITQDKNHISWNKKASRVFSPELSFFDSKTSEALGTHHLQATVTMARLFSLGYWSWIFLLLWIRFLNIWDNVPMDLEYVCQQYFTYMCFPCFIRYNKTFIACGYRKYENLFTHKYHICPSGDALREYDTLEWINFHISLTNMQ